MTHAIERGGLLTTGPPFRKRLVFDGNMLNGRCAGHQFMCTDRVVTRAQKKLIQSSVVKERQGHLCVLLYIWEAPPTINSSCTYIYLQAGTLSFPCFGVLVEEWKNYWRDLIQKHWQQRQWRDIHPNLTNADHSSIIHSNSRCSWYKYETGGATAILMTPLLTALSLLETLWSCGLTDPPSDGCRNKSRNLLCVTESFWEPPHISIVALFVYCCGLRHLLCFSGCDPMLRIIAVLITFVLSLPADVDRFTYSCQSVYLF